MSNETITLKIDYDNQGDLTAMTIDFSNNLVVKHEGVSATFFENPGVVIPFKPKKEIEQNEE